MAYAGGTLFVLYAAFQCVAIVLAVRLRTTFTEGERHATEGKSTAPKRFLSNPTVGVVAYYLLSPLSHEEICVPHLNNLIKHALPLSLLLARLVAS